MKKTQKINYKIKVESQVLKNQKIMNKVKQKMKFYQVQK